VTAADSLHRLVYSQLDPGIYWHVFGLEYGPLASHPRSTSRFALVRNQPSGVIVRSAFYFAWSREAALWETALRDAQAINGVVSVHPDWTKGRGLARLRLMRPLPIIALDHPARRAVIDVDSVEDQRWHGHLTTNRYRRTYRASAAVDLQCRAADPTLPLPGFRWHSRQLQADLVAVMFEPTFDPRDWEVEQALVLDSDEGQAALGAALARANFALRAGLGSVGGTPPDDEDL
jgi:hypothetical protein